MIVIWKAFATLFWKCQTQICLADEGARQFYSPPAGSSIPISWKIHPIGKFGTSRVHQESPKNHWSMPKYKASPVFVWDMLLCVYEYVDIYICRCVCLFPICLLLASPYLWHVGALVIHGLGASHQLYNGEIQNTHQLNNRKM